MKLWHRNIVTPRASPLRVVTDLVFAMTLLVMLVLALLGGLLGVMYWTKWIWALVYSITTYSIFFELSRHEVNFV